MSTKTKEIWDLKRNLNLVQKGLNLLLAEVVEREKNDQVDGRAKTRRRRKPNTDPVPIKLAKDLETLTKISNRRLVDLHNRMLENYPNIQKRLGLTPITRIQGVRETALKNISNINAAMEKRAEDNPKGPPMQVKDAGGTASNQHH